MCDEQEPITIRPMGPTEHSWCKAVPGGTGTTTLALLLSKQPNLVTLQSAIDSLQTKHPVLRSRIRREGNSFSLLTPSLPHVTVRCLDLPCPDATFWSVLEHEINLNAWREHADYEVEDPDSNIGLGVFFITVYSGFEDEDDSWAVVLRLHTAVCDRTSSAEVLRELLERVGGTEKELEGKNEVSLGIEDCVPPAKKNKPLWARGIDMLGYSLNSFKLSNLDFVDARSARSSQVVRLKLDLESTNQLLFGCKSRGIGLCGALSAAGLIAARLSKSLPDQQWEKYAVVTLIDCRSGLEPVLTSQHIGFYHSGILNTHDIRGGESLWELAKRTYESFSNAKNNNKHFSDMSGLNFLMCKAIENPGLTPSSSMRTSFISVFEDPVIEHTSEVHQQVGVKDYIGCASAHGVGPTIAIFDTIRDGELDCAFVYPSPLHSREQMEKLVGDMKRVLVDACSSVEN